MAISGFLLLAIGGFVAYSLHLSLRPPSALDVGDVRIALATTPNPATLGSNALAIRIADRSGAPVEVGEVSVKYGTELSGMANRVPATPKEEGLYAAGVEFPTAGPWQVTVSLKRPGQPDLESTWTFNVGLATPQAGPAIGGTVRIAPALASRVGADDVLYVVARRGPGPPLAVLRVPGPAFPLSYRLTPREVMVPGTPFEGEVSVLARLKRGGGAGPPGPGDLEGSFPRNPARVGETDVDILIDRAY